VNLRPLGDRLVVEHVEQAEKSAGGVFLPDTAKEKPQEGEVVAVGAGKIEKGRRIPMDVNVGDRILFGKYTGNDIKVEDQDYLILNEDEILVKVKRMAKAASGRK